MKRRKLFIQKLRADITKKIQVQLFGEIAKGEKVKEPMVSTTYPKGEGPDRDISHKKVFRWLKQYHVGTRYLHKPIHID